MPLIRKIEDLTPTYPYPVITLGNFDGVHLGHQALFQRVKERAGQMRGTSMVMTFWPHPMRVLRKDVDLPLITVYDQKMELLERQGLDVIICLDFTPELAAIPPRDFVRSILVDRIGVKEVIIGHDFRFGARGEGNRALLIEMGREHGFVVDTVGPQSDAGDQIISSTRIREVIRAGAVDEAPALLGRYYRISGRVVRGKSRGGKLLGFPTANLKLADELVPRTGVYAVLVTFQGQVYPGVANIGYNPTFGDVGLSVEVHCFDFSYDIYDREIKVDFVRRVRSEKKFSGPDELKAQIAQDCQLARQILTDSK
jgi:riboflavin kinase/FMN adenylyltransferase